MSSSGRSPSPPSPQGPRPQTSRGPATGPFASGISERAASGASAPSDTLLRGNPTAPPKNRGIQGTPHPGMRDAAPSHPQPPGAVPGSMSGAPPSSGLKQTRETTLPTLSLQRLWRGTGLGIKVRFLLALTLLSLSPAFLLVVVFQQVTLTNEHQTAQHILQVSARTTAGSILAELTQKQAILQRLAAQSSIAQLQGTSSAAAITQSEVLLAHAGLAEDDAVAWVVLGSENQILAASPSTLRGQALGAFSLLANPAPLVAFVQQQRSLPPPQEGKEAPLAVATGQDASISGINWAAELAFVAPSNPAHSVAVLSVFSLQQSLHPLLAPFSSDPTSYTLLVNTEGIILAVSGSSDPLEQQLETDLGHQLPSAALKQAVASTLAPEGPSDAPLLFHDALTGTNEQAAGTAIGTLGWACFVVAAPTPLLPADSGILSPRNTPLLFLGILVATVLVATWVAFPIVRPIRRATREILATTNGVRVLAKQAEQIASDHQLGTNILEGAAKGLDLRRQTLSRDAGLAMQSLQSAHQRVIHLANMFSDARDPRWSEFRTLMIGLRQNIIDASHQIQGMGEVLERDTSQVRLNEVMAGAGEISQQFTRASADLQAGATKLEHAAEVLQ